MSPAVLLLHAHSARMRSTADASAALVVTSPPYFPDALEPELRAGKLTEAAIARLRPQIEAYAWSLRPVFDECARVLMPGGRMVVQTRDVRLQSLLLPIESIHRQQIEAAGLRLFTKHFWRPLRTSPMRRKSSMSLESKFGPKPQDPEVFLVFHKPGAQRPCKATAQDSAFLQQDALVTHPGRLRAGHRFQSPLPVIEAVIRCHSLPGDLVVDPFAGGGTTLVAAAKLGRTAHGYEIEPSTFAKAARNCRLDATSVP